MKKVGYWIAGVLLLIVVIGFFARGYIGVIAMTLFMQPDHAFGDESIPLAPDYSNESNWAALPWRKDSADVTPSSKFPDNQAAAQVDVFFVHPTTYVSSEAWNQHFNTSKTLQDFLLLEFYYYQDFLKHWNLTTHSSLEDDFKLP